MAGVIYTSWGFYLKPIIGIDSRVIRYLEINAWSWLKSSMPGFHAGKEANTGLLLKEIQQVL